MHLHHGEEDINRVAVNIVDVNKGARETGSASAQVLSSAKALSSDSNHLPTPLVVLLAALGACALALGGVAGWNRVLTRRTR